MSIRILNLLVATIILFPASAWACTCMAECEYEILAGDEVPADFTAIAIARPAGVNDTLSAELLRDDNGNWVNVGSSFDGNVVTPDQAWAMGERYRLVIDNETSGIERCGPESFEKEFEIVAAAAITNAEIEIDVQEDGIDLFGHPPFSPDTCGEVLPSDIARVEISLSPEIQPYAEFVQVRQLVNQEPWIHSTGLCDRAYANTQPEGGFPLAVPCIGAMSPTTLLPGTLNLEYEASIAGAPFDIDSASSTLTLDCSDYDPGEFDDIDFGIGTGSDMGEQEPGSPDAGDVPDMSANDSDMGRNGVPRAGDPNEDDGGCSTGSAGPPTFVLVILFAAFLTRRVYAPVRRS